MTLVRHPLTPPPAAALLAAALGATVAGAAAPAGTLLAQQHGSPMALAFPGHAAQAVDSPRVLKRARGAQADFERNRQYRLPRAWDQGRGPCDELVGRFCLTLDDGDEDERDAPPKPAEPKAIVQRRERLLARLDTAFALLPGDDWIVGQRVRYLVEAGHDSVALASLDDCRATTWWCAALTGYVRHDLGDFEGAERAFAAALDGMPAEERERWNDPAPILDGDGYGAFKKTDPAARDSMLERFWWLGDPLWSVPGNDRRTEHWARLVVNRLQDRARTAEGLSWGFDMRELLLRYGVPERAERLDPRIGQLGAPPPIRSHFRSHGREFLPPFRALRDSAGLDHDWPINPKRSRTQYSPAYARFADSLPHQIAVFRAGDSAVVVAAYELPPDSARAARDDGGEAQEMAAGDSSAARAPADSSVEAALVLASGPRAEPAIARLTTTGRRAALRLAVGPERPPAEMVSVEMLSRGLERAARARELLRFPADSGAMSLSDILLISAEEPLPATLDEAVPRARGTTRVRSGERIALYWETYGPAIGGAPLEVTITMVPEKSGWLRRRLEQIGVASAPSESEMKWEVAPPTAEPLQHHTLGITLPDLPPGRYTVRVTVAQSGTGEAVRERGVWVEGR
ncbi:MAG TPA: hypothetical protein VFS05_12525 [Gemmatimonadaceae bacterium]|nr:hypothetical protein [Gemmatimonadaceae bacterium]